MIDILRGLSRIFKKQPTGELKNIIGAYNQELNIAAHDTSLIDLQFNILNAEGIWLDEWGSWFGMPRLKDEPDELYAKRIVSAAGSKAKITVSALIAITKAYIGDPDAFVSIYEPFQNVRRFSHSTFSGRDKFQDELYYRAGVADLITPVNADEHLRKVINETKSAGVKMYFSQRYELHPEPLPFSPPGEPTPDYFKSLTLKIPSKEIGGFGHEFSGGYLFQPRSGKEIIWYSDLVTQIYTGNASLVDVPLFIHEHDFREVQLYDINKVWNHRQSYESDIHLPQAILLMGPQWMGYTSEQQGYSTPMNPDRIRITDTSSFREIMSPLVPQTNFRDTLSEKQMNAIFVLVFDQVCDTVSWAQILSYPMNPSRIRITDTLSEKQMTTPPPAVVSIYLDDTIMVDLSRAYIMGGLFYNSDLREIQSRAYPMNPDRLRISDHFIEYLLSSSELAKTHHTTYESEKHITGSYMLGTSFFDHLFREYNIMSYPMNANRVRLTDTLSMRELRSDPFVLTDLGSDSVILIEVEGSYAGGTLFYQSNELTTNALSTPSSSFSISSTNFREQDSLSPMSPTTIYGASEREVFLPEIALGQIFIDDTVTTESNLSLVTSGRYVSCGSMATLRELLDVTIEDVDGHVVNSQSPVESQTLPV